MKAVILILVTLGGIYLVIRGFLKNVNEIKTKPKNSHTIVDKVFNYPLMVIWYSYLFVFLIGLTVNNLIFK